MDYQFDWSVVWAPATWLEAMWTTLAYGLSTSFIGLLLGLLFGLTLISRMPVVSHFVLLFISVFRSTPALIQIVWFYYAFPIVLNIDLPAWVAAGLGLTLYMSAFSAEIFRGGIQSLEKGQWDASGSLCMSYVQTMYYVILPQAFRRMTPAFVNQAIINFKNTSLLSVISVHELMYTASSQTATHFRPLEVFTFAALLYFLIIWPLAHVAYRLEQRFY